MTNQLTPADIRKAIRLIKQRDPVMAVVIERVGEFLLKPDPKPFRMLARSIVAQQISTGAARSILNKLETMLKPRRLSAAAILSCDEEKLKSVGLSRQKVSYLKELARAVSARRLRLARLSRESDEEIIRELTLLPGIGTWTAQMFLIFCLGRPDVFAWQDYGLRVALRRFYSLAALPDRTEACSIAEKWQPYRTVGSWYCWRSLELPLKD